MTKASWFEFMVGKQTLKLFLSILDGQCKHCEALLKFFNLFLIVCRPVPPNIAGESTPQNASVLLNRQVTLECKSDAVPPPTLSWLKDGQPLQVTFKRKNQDPSHDHNIVDFN